MILNSMSMVAGQLSYRENSILEKTVGLPHQVI